MSITNKQKVILVTGATGLVGNAIQHVVNEQKLNNNDEIQNEDWIFVSSKDANLCDMNETKHLFAKYRPTHVVHLAAYVGGLYTNMYNNLDFLKRNLSINYNVLDACYTYGIKKAVSCLSTCIYPDKTTYPIDETMIHNGPPHPTNYGFSYAKRVLDILNRAYYEQHGCVYTSVIPCNVFGPHDNFNSKTAHVIPSFIRRMDTAKQNGDEQFVVYGTGTALRQFVYSRDLARLILWTLRNYDSVDPIHLTVDEKEEVSIANVAHTVKLVLNYQGEIVCDATREEGQYRKPASNKKLRTYLPYFEFTNFEKALQDTVQWYRDNREEIRK